MLVHSHTSLPSQLAILRCCSYLSVLYFPLILLSVRRVPSRVDVLPFSLSAFCCCFSPCVRHSSVLVPFPVCATQGQHLLLSFFRMHACMLSYLSVHEHSLICHCIISSVLVPFPVCATQAAYTRHSLPLPSTVVFRRELSWTLLQNATFSPPTFPCASLRHSGRKRHFVTSGSRCVLQRRRLA